MLTGKEISDLLHTLQGQFYRLTRIALARRSASHENSAHPQLEPDITASLYEQIDKLARDRKPAAADSDPAHFGLTPRPHKRERSHPLRKTETQPNDLIKTPNGLSRHFKQARPSTSLQPELGRKLQQSAWNYINTSLRLARQGNVKQARLHVELANSSLKEGAKFIPREEYIKFVAQVKTRLELLDE